MAESHGGFRGGGDRDRQRNRAGRGGCRAGPSRLLGAAPVEGDGMIPVLTGTPPDGVRVPIATPPADFRRVPTGWRQRVQSVLPGDPFRGTVFVFCSKRADRVKRLVDDGTGLVLVWKGPDSRPAQRRPVADHRPHPRSRSAPGMSNLLQPSRLCNLTGNPAGLAALPPQSSLQ
jgi:hypothetical protein